MVALYLSTQEATERSGLEQQVSTSGEEPHPADCHGDSDAGWNRVRLLVDAQERRRQERRLKDDIDPLQARGPKDHVQSRTHVSVVSPCLAVQVAQRNPRQSQQI